MWLNLSSNLNCGKVWQPTTSCLSKLITSTTLSYPYCMQMYCFLVCKKYVSLPLHARHNWFCTKIYCFAMQASFRLTLLSKIIFRGGSGNRVLIQEKYNATNISRSTYYLKAKWSVLSSSLCAHDGTKLNHHLSSIHTSSPLYVPEQLLHSHMSPL